MRDRKRFVTEAKSAARPPSKTYRSGRTIAKSMPAASNHFVVRRRHLPRPWPKRAGRTRRAGRNGSPERFEVALIFLERSLASNDVKFPAPNVVEQTAFSASIHDTRLKAERAGEATAIGSEKSEKESGSLRTAVR